MNHTKNFLEELILLKKSPNTEFSLIVKKNRYRLDDVIIFKKNLPIRGKIVNGGKNSSDDFILQIKAIICEPGLGKILSDVMLGPNYEFEELEMCITNTTDNLDRMLLTVNVISCVQKKSKVGLTMNIIKIIQK